MFQKSLHLYKFLIYYKSTTFGNFLFFFNQLFLFQMVQCVSIFHIYCVHILHSKIYFLFSHDFKDNILRYLQIFKQVLFDIRFCTKYLVSPSNVDITCILSWAVYFSSLTKSYQSFLCLW